jgi:hypothetical protein
MQKVTFPGMIVTEFSHFTVFSFFYFGLALPAGN